MKKYNHLDIPLIQTSAKRLVLGKTKRQREEWK